MCFFLSNLLLLVIRWGVFAKTADKSLQSTRETQETASDTFVIKREKRRKEVSMRFREEKRQREGEAALQPSCKAERERLSPFCSVGNKKK